MSSGASSPTCSIGPVDGVRRRRSPGGRWSRRCCSSSDRLPVAVSGRALRRGPRSGPSDGAGARTGSGRGRWSASWRSSGCSMAASPARRWSWSTPRRSRVAATARSSTRPADPWRPDDRHVADAPGRDPGVARHRPTRPQPGRTTSWSPARSPGSRRSSPTAPIRVSPRLPTATTSRSISRAPPKGTSGITPLWPLYKIEYTIAHLGCWRRLSHHAGTEASARAWLKVASVGYLASRAAATGRLGGSPPLSRRSLAPVLPGAADRPSPHLRGLSRRSPGPCPPQGHSRWPSPGRIRPQDLGVQSRSGSKS